MIALINLIVMGFMFGASVSATSAIPAESAVLEQASVLEVPFYSQFTDISSPAWRGKACGVASLAMIINFYHPDIVSAQTLLEEGLASGAYLKNAGWTHKGLVQLSNKYGLTGETYDLSKLSREVAFEQFVNFLVDGPVIASVYNEFDPNSTIPHLVVIDGVKDGVVYFSDPAAKSGDGEISIEDFMTGWKQRFIVIRPQK